MRPHVKRESDAPTWILYIRRDPLLSLMHKRRYIAHHITQKCRDRFVIIRVSVIGENSLRWITCSPINAVGKWQMVTTDIRGKTRYYVIFPEILSSRVKFHCAYCGSFSGNCTHRRMHTAFSHIYLLISSISYVCTEYLAAIDTPHVCKFHQTECKISLPFCKQLRTVLSYSLIELLISAWLCAKMHQSFLINDSKFTWLCTKW